MGLHIDVLPGASRIRGHVPGNVSMALRYSLGWDVPGAEYADVEHWDGRATTYDRRTQTFPTGLLDTVLDVLKKNRYKLGAPEGRDDSLTVHQYALPAPTESIPINPGFPHPWDFQESAITQALEATRGMVAVATGGGKTMIATHIISRLGFAALFLVHTKDLLYQAKSTFERAFGEDNVGQVGDGVVQPSLITVCTIQTVSRFLGVQYEVLPDEEEWLDPDTNPDARFNAMVQGAGVVIMDECHRVAAPTALDTMLSIDAPYRFGLSASPWRDDNATPALYGAFGGITSMISASDLAEMGYLVRPVIRMLDVPFELSRNKKDYQSVYAHAVVRNDTRNAMGADAAARMIGRGRQVLVLVQQIAHGIEMQKALGERLGYLPVFLSGSDSSTMRNEVLDSMRRQERACLIATSIADEGLDIPSLSGLVLMGSGKSSVKALQRVGRTLRIHEDKENAEIVDFEDPYKYLTKHSARRRQLYGEEPAWIVTDI